MWRSRAPFFANEQTLEVGLGLMATGSADRISPGWVMKEPIIHDVTEALGRPYEYDKGVLEELTSAWAEAKYLHGWGDSQSITIGLKNIHY